MNPKLKGKVLVTGATGHVGYTLAKMLVERGYNVRVGVRDSQNKHKIALLEQLGTEIVELDITNPEQAESAVDGTEGVFHVAAVFKFGLKKEEIINPTVEGALNILRASHKAGVKRVVYTSSVIAMGNFSTPEKPIDENDWNDKTKVPYQIAKTLAEKQVWEYAKENDLDVISINPVFILGPNFQKHSSSTITIRDMMYDNVPVIPPIAFNIVDVRDVSMAHIIAYEKQDAKGRYIVGNNNPMTYSDILEQVNIHHPISIPKRKLNRLMFIIYAYINTATSKIRGKSPRITPAQAREYSKGLRYIDNSKTEIELGLQTRSPAIAIKDTIEWIKSNPQLM